jgi:hypothetical protein
MCGLVWFGVVWLVQTCPVLHSTPSCSTSYPYSARAYWSQRSLIRCPHLVPLFLSVGGATPQETDSGLFVYSTEPIFATAAPAHPDDSCGNIHDGTQSYGDSNACEVKAGGDYYPLPGGNSDVTPRDRLYWDGNRISPVARDHWHVRKHPRMVAQVDLVPTLSLLLGLPIPYSSLGAIIPEFFHQATQQKYGGSNRHGGSSSEKLSTRLAVLEALRVNCAQVRA